MSKHFIACLILLFSSLVNSSELHQALLDKAKSGNAEANYHLGMLHNNGIGVEKSPVEAFRLFQKAAENGDALGHYKVGCYFSGQFGEIDSITLSKDKAFEHKLIAAEAGYLLAQNDIAAIYYRDGDISKTIKWLQKAGEQGHVQSLSNLFSLYQAADSALKNDKHAYLALLKIESLIPKDQRLAKLKFELENKLKKTDIEQINSLMDDWKPSVTPLTQQAQQGISRSRIIAGLPLKD